MIGTAMPDLTLLIQGFALGLSAAASPGPFQTYLVTQTLNNGGKHTLPVAFAPLISDIPIVLVILLLLDQLPARFLHLISLAGGAFVLYLSWSLLRQWLRQAPADSADSSGYPGTGRARWARNALARGVLINSLSPGPYTFWTLVSGPILLAALRNSWLNGAAFLIGFYGALIGGFVGIVFLFHQAHALGRRAVRTFTLVSILILIIFGGLLIYQGLRG